jgi:hypothetical protein
MFRILAIVATLFGVIAAAHADVYRWTDPKGQVQYSDKWVPGSVIVKTDKNHLSGSAPTTTPDTPPKPDTNSKIDQQREQEHAEQTVKQDLAKNREQQCKEATEQYNKAISSRRLYREGKDGAREYMSDTDADAYRASLVTTRDQLCSK